MNIKLKSLSVELIFLSVETESVHLRVSVPANVESIHLFITIKVINVFNFVVFVVNTP